MTIELQTAPNRAPRARLLFSLGFRPFFFAAGLWAVVAMTLWVISLAGYEALPWAGDAVLWHSHEMVFGYLSAALAGFLLTAAPSWTGQPPIKGRALAALFAAWIGGRAAIYCAGVLPTLVVALADLAMPMALAILTGRQIFASRNWRNLTVLGTVVLLILGNVVFFVELAQGIALGGAGLRLGLMAGLMMVSVVGGRIVPNFTRNWLSRRGAGPLAEEPAWLGHLMNAALFGALGLWVVLPGSRVAAFALFLAGGAHLFRLSTYGGLRTLSDPLVWVLHLAYAFLPLGALVLASAIWTFGNETAALHLLTIGAVGLTTLAVMTRATLGHSGGALSVGRGTAVLYLLIAGAAVLRPLAGVTGLVVLQDLAALAWIIGFMGFVATYGARQLGVKSGL